ncbi:Flp family type IVb pilin [Nocardioides pakistanensis]
MLQYMRIRLATKRRTDRGATAVEYGLLVALIAAAIVAIVALLGQNILEGFTTVNTKLDNPTG